MLLRHIILCDHRDVSFKMVDDLTHFVLHILLRIKPRLNHTSLVSKRRFQETGNWLGGCLRASLS